MTYTVQLDFVINDDEILSDDAITDTLKFVLEESNCQVRNIKVLDVND